MKPTPEQVVAHFGLPAEAVGSPDLKRVLRACPELPEHTDQMRLINWGFVSRFGRPITDYFKTNDGLEDSGFSRDGQP